MGRWRVLRGGCGGWEFDLLGEDHGAREMECSGVIIRWVQN
jgi:hypothetical protein